MKPYEKLKDFRNNRNMTTYELSELTGIPQSTISKMENGKRKIEAEELEILAKALNKNINDFFNKNSETELSTNQIEKDFPIIPKEFTSPEEARAYVMKHQIFAYGGFYPEKMSDEDIINFANEMIHQAELIKYKYESKYNK